MYIPIPTILGVIFLLCGVAFLKTSKDKDKFDKDEAQAILSDYSLNIIDALAKYNLEVQHSLDSNTDSLKTRIVKLIGDRNKSDSTFQKILSEIEGTKKEPTLVIDFNESFIKSDTFRARLILENIGEVPAKNIKVRFFAVMTTDNKSQTLYHEFKHNRSVIEPYSTAYAGGGWLTRPSKIFDARAYLYAYIEYEYGNEKFIIDECYTNEVDGSWNLYTFREQIRQILVDKGAFKIQ